MRWKWEHKIKKEKVALGSILWSFDLLLILTIILFYYVLLILSYHTICIKRISIGRKGFHIRWSYLLIDLIYFLANSGGFVTPNEMEIAQNLVNRHADWKYLFHFPIAQGPPLTWLFFVLGDLYFKKQYWKSPSYT